MFHSCISKVWAYVVSQLFNKVFSNLNSLRYTLSEPALLFLARARYEKGYTNSHQSPLITVYTPTYNRSSILMERAFTSVLAQSYKNFEYVIVGDHCNDETEKLVSEVKDPRIRFYNLPNRGWRYPETAENHWLAGPVVPANQALEMATGQWIARIDDDDTWTPDHLEVLLKLAQDNNYEFVSGQYETEENGKKKIHEGVRASSYYSYKQKTNNDNGPLIGGTSTWLYRSYLKFMRYNINCWRKSWNRVNDTDFGNRIFKSGVRMGFLPKVLSHVLPRPGESQVGLKAYLSSANEKEEHYKFNS